MLRVLHEGRNVIMDLGSSMRDICLSPLEAERLEFALRDNADRAEKEQPTLFKGEIWNMRVLSFDRKVVIRVWPPLGVTTAVIPLPIEIARKMADQIRFCIQQAGYGVRFETSRASQSCRKGI